MFLSPTASDLFWGQTLGIPLQGVLFDYSLQGGRNFQHASTQFGRDVITKHSTPCYIIIIISVISMGRHVFDSVHFSHGRRFGALMASVQSLERTGSLSQAWLLVGEQRPMQFFWGAALHSRNPSDFHSHPCLALASVRWPHHYQTLIPKFKCSAVVKYQFQFKCAHIIEIVYLSHNRPC